MKTFLRIIKYAPPLVPFAIKYFIITMTSIVFGLFNITLAKPLLDIIFDQLTSEDMARIAVEPNYYLGTGYINDLVYHYLYLFTIEYGKLGSLVFICIIILIASLVANLTKYLSVVILETMRINMMKTIRVSMFEKISRMHIGYFSDQRKGDLISRASNDLSAVEYTFSQTVKIFFRDPATIIIYFIFLFSTSFQLTIFTLILLPVSGYIISAIAKKLRSMARLNQSSLGNIMNILDEAIGGMRVIKAFNAESFVNRRYKNEVKNYTRLNIEIIKRYELSSPLSETLGLIAIVGILLFGGNLILQKQLMDPSEFLVYLAVFSLIISPAKNIAGSFSNVQRGLGAADRVFEVIDTKPSIKDKPNAKVLEQFTDSIEFKNVTFAYQEIDVLKNINLKIGKGQMIALVGPSGGGKSTLADLIPRFYDPQKGEVQIDGRSIDDYTLHSVRAQMGIVTQESILFNDTIFNNIAFGMEGVSEEQVMEAAKIANAHEFIAQLPEGYHTNIGERGSKLSGGQRQRLSIARAVLANPPILILDEATSALDSESEKLVQDALNSLMKNRTSVVIAHRLSTIQHADLIVVVKEGEIVEKGSHDELISHGGVYSKLIEIQSF